MYLSTRFFKLYKRDTCYIEETSSTEFSEEINSMDGYYNEAAVCFVFLEDVDPDEASFRDA